MDSCTEGPEQKQAKSELPVSINGELMTEAGKSDPGEHAKNRTQSRTPDTKPQHNMKHTVQAGETLAGLAIKYETTIEDILRANSMWVNDSLFLREYLLIPVTSASDEQLNAEQEEVSTSARLESQAVNSVSDIGQKTENTASAKDFLSKYDSQLAHIKSKVKELGKTSEMPSDKVQLDLPHDGTDESAL